MHDAVVNSSRFRILPRTAGVPVNVTPLSISTNLGAVLKPTASRRHKKSGEKKEKNLFHTVIP